MYESPLVNVLHSERRCIVCCAEVLSCGQLHIPCWHDNNWRKVLGSIRVYIQTGARRRILYITHIALGDSQVMIINPNTIRMTFGAGDCNSI